ncbi:MAG: hypothetical protein AB7H66_15120 [Hyphomonadaceae bacterium]
MRKLILAALMLAHVGAAWALGEPNTARPGAAFAILEAESAGACERLCVEDTLCMAWSYRDNLCELKAVVPRAIAEDGSVSGVSARAPASLRTTPMREAMAEERSPLQPPASVESATETIRLAAEADLSDQLLGGLSPEGDLRVRLGN